MRGSATDRSVQAKRDAELLPASGERPAETLLDRRHAVADGSFVHAEPGAGFAKYFGERALHPVEYVEQDWTAEEFSRGCYGGRMGTDVWTRYAQALSEQIGRIHWAGTETADVWNGYMDGAVRSGERAAEEALTALAESTAVA
jgi:hypothetical protein